MLWETTAESRFNWETSGHVMDFRKIQAVTLSSLSLSPLMFSLNVLAWGEVNTYFWSTVKQLAG